MKQKGKCYLKYMYNEMSNNGSNVEDCTTMILSHSPSAVFIGRESSTQLLRQKIQMKHQLID